MTEWNETTLRSAASWKAFKEGKALFENGSVSGAKAGDSSWSGTVKDGKRTFKASVKVNSKTDLETRCACPENQSTGALCPHGVAIGLAVLGGPPKPAAAPAHQSLKQVLGFDLSLPTNWMEALKKGKLTATLTAGSEIGQADERISDWLSAMGQTPKFPLHLHLDGERLGTFLKHLTDHPRVIVGKTKELLEIHEGGRVSIDRLERNDSAVTLFSQADEVTKIGGHWWRLGPAEISRIGLGAADPILNQVISDIAIHGRAKLELPQLLERLERWQEWLDFPENSWLEEIHFVPAPAAFELRLEGSLQRLEAVLSVRYGAANPVIPGMGSVAGLPQLSGNRCEIRNWKEEQLAVLQLAQSSFQSIAGSASQWKLEGEDAVLQFLSRDLPRLRTAWKVEEGERFKTAQKQVSFVEPKIQILGSGEDWLSFDLTFQSNDGSVISAAEVRKLLAAGGGKSGKRIIVSKDVSNTIEPLFAELDLRQEGGHFVTSKRDGEVVLEISKNLSKNHDSKELIQISNDLVEAEMRPYQSHGAGWLIDRSKRFGGGLLADDMGLGKTLQAIACIERLFQESGEDSGTVLVIATASLLGNWKAEFAKFASARSVRILHGVGREKQQAAALPGEVLLTTFGTLPRDLAWYLKQKFRAVVVDEASLMRNPDTDHAKAISKLNAGARIALTGTPIENGVRDLWSIFRFIQPGWLGSREDFKERYEMCTGEPAAMERLRLKTSPFMLRRTKEEVAPELPSKIFIEEYCDLTSDQQGVYRDLLVEGRKKVEAILDSGNPGAARMQVLTALLRLRQTCCDLALLGSDRFKQMSVSKRSAKLQRLMELIEEAVSGGHKILVFSQFQTQLREIEKCLLEQNYSCLKLDGQTKKRQEMVDRFQSADGPPVFLISLKAGGYGLNLTAADIVVHFDPWWNPAAEAQATDRAHRIGQTRPVTVYRLITRGTVEEKVVSLQKKKREIAASIDESGAGDSAGWSETELMDLMRG
jgi:superfamily II DNA or RNA helicase